MAQATSLTAYNQLIGRVGGVVPPHVAMELVQQAWRTICQRRQWGFLFAEGYLIAPGAMSGTMGLVRGSKVFTPATALKDLIESPSLTPLVGIGKLAVRVNGDIYQIRSYDSTSHTGEFDRIWLGASGDFSVTIFRQYFTPPISDAEDGVESGNFRNWLSIVDVATAQPLNVNRSYNWVNRTDPKRSQTGTPVYLIPAPYDLKAQVIGGTGGQLFELWPHYIGTEDKIYHCRYLRDYTVLSETNGSVQSQLPDVISLKYLVAQARLAAYEWAMANVDKYEEFKDVRWPDLIQLVAAEVEDEYLTARRNDQARTNLDLDDFERRPYNLTSYNQGTAPYPFVYPQ